MYRNLKFLHMTDFFSTDTVRVSVTNIRYVSSLCTLKVWSFNWNWIPWVLPSAPSHLQLKGRSSWKGHQNEFKGINIVLETWWQDTLIRCMRTWCRSLKIQIIIFVCLLAPPSGDQEVSQFQDPVPSRPPHLGLSGLICSQPWLNALDWIWQSVTWVWILEGRPSRTKKADGELNGFGPGMKNEFTHK